jgi:hydroxyacylglutathione hydrolase
MRIEPIPAFEDNYIWALSGDGTVAVVDPGEAAPVERFLARTGNRLGAILVTHRHGDHIGGIAELVAHRPVPVYGPALEAAEVVTHPLRDGDRVMLPALGIDFEVLSLPGHTLGHVAYYAPAGQPQGGMSPPVGGSEPDLRAWGANPAPAGQPQAQEGMLFCGDVLFGAGCGRVFEGTMAQMQASLARIAALPPATQIYCAHEYTQSCLRFARTVEPDSRAIATRSEQVASLRAAGEPTVPFPLAVELDTNPFLRWDAATVRAAVAARLGHAPADAVETFAAVRNWKDNG